MNQQTIHVNLLTEISEKQPTYLAIGSFDGVHLGSSGSAAVRWWRRQKKMG